MQRKKERETCVFTPPFVFFFILGYHRIHICIYRTSTMRQIIGTNLFPKYCGFTDGNSTNLQSHISFSSCRLAHPSLTLIAIFHSLWCGCSSKSASQKSFSLERDWKLGNSGKVTLKISMTVSLEFFRTDWKAFAWWKTKQGGMSHLITWPSD